MNSVIVDLVPIELPLLLVLEISIDLRHELGTALLDSLLDLQLRFSCRSGALQVVHLLVQACHSPQISASSVAMANNFASAAGCHACRKESVCQAGTIVGGIRIKNVRCNILLQLIEVASIEVLGARNEPSVH